MTTTTNANYCTVDAQSLRTGVQLRTDVYDSRSVLLLASGKVITPRVRQRLLSRGIKEVRVHESELGRITAMQPQGRAKEAPADRVVSLPRPVRTEYSDQLDEMSLKVATGLPPQGDAFVDSLQKHAAVTYSPTTIDTFVGQREQKVGHVASTFDTLLHKRVLDLDGLQSVVDEAMQEMIKDVDLFACLGINPCSGGYPARHSVQTTMLAAAIGTQLKLDRQTLKELTLGCLIHDAGMLQIDRNAFDRGDVLDQVEFLEITKHPVLVFDLIKNREMVPQRAAFVAYQIHERENGTGYPRQRCGSQIHFLSKIAAVADTFVGLVSPRQHRPAMLPYAAMARMLHSTREGLFDPLAVRALLRAVSLFPLGSFVELNDKRVGRVIRSNGDAYNRPTVEVWNPQVRYATLEVVDLSQTPDLQVVRTPESVALPETEPEPESPVMPPASVPAPAKAKVAASAEDFWE